MPSVFTRIIKGELPGRFVWRDQHCVAILSKNPLKPGHTLVVPIREVDHWIDMPVELTQHLFGVSQTVGKAIQHAFQPKKVGMMLVGLEVLHAHVHLVPIETVRDMDFDNQDPSPKDADLDAAADKLRASLKALELDKGAQATR